MASFQSSIHQISASGVRLGPSQMGLDLGQTGWIPMANQKQMPRFHALALPTKREITPPVWNLVVRNSRPFVAIPFHPISRDPQPSCLGEFISNPFRGSLDSERYKRRPGHLEGYSLNRPAPCISQSCIERMEMGQDGEIRINKDGLANSCTAPATS